MNFLLSYIVCTLSYRNYLYYLYISRLSIFPFVLCVCLCFVPLCMECVSCDLVLHYFALGWGSWRKPYVNGEDFFLLRFTKTSLAAISGLCCIIIPKNGVSSWARAFWGIYLESWHNFYKIGIVLSAIYFLLTFSACNVSLGTGIFYSHPCQ